MIEYSKYHEHHCVRETVHMVKIKTPFHILIHPILISAAEQLAEVDVSDCAAKKKQTRGKYNHFN